jgi:serine/threonine-protein kinase
MNPPLVGTQIGEFIVGHHLNEGGMGTVYQAYRAGSSEPLAIKFLLPQFAADAEFRRRFAREVTVLQQLQHPNIVPIYAVGEYEGLPYFVMRRIRGPSLAHVLAQYGFSPASARSIFDPLAAALALAHAHGVLHRDVKPGNILLESWGPPRPGPAAVYLVDFGLSQVLGGTRLTAPGVTAGSANYLAPEQLQQQPLTPRIDVYALGLVVYEMLVGQRAFDGTRDDEIALLHLTSDPPAPHLLNPAFPAALEAVLAQATDRDPLARFDSVEAFHAAYLAALAGLPPAAQATAYGRPLAAPADSP